MIGAFFCSGPTAGAKLAGFMMTDKCHGSPGIGITDLGQLHLEPVCQAMNADRSSLIQDFLKPGRTGGIKADTLLSNCWVDIDGGSKAMLEYLLLEESGCFRDGHDKVAIDSMLAGENLLLIER